VRKRKGDSPRKLIGTIPSFIIRVIVWNTTQIKGPNHWHPVGFFILSRIFPPSSFFLDTVHGQISRYTLPSSQSGFFPFLPLRPPGILATASHPATGLDYESPHIVGFSFFFTTNHTNCNASTRRGSPSRPPPWSQLFVNPKSTDWGWFLKTYPRVRILTYSPRTGTRSKCPQDPWGVDLSLEPNHRSRLQDAVGFFFFTTTNKQIPTGTTHTGLFFPPTTT